MTDNTDLLDQAFELLGFRADSTATGNRRWSRKNVEVTTTADGRFHVRPNPGVGIVLFSADTAADIIRLLRLAESMFRDSR